MNVSRVPEERPPETAAPRFEDLPVLTVSTTLTDAGEHIIEECNQQFRDRLDRPESGLVGRPLGELYDSAGVPNESTPADDNRRGAQFDGGDSVSATDPASEVGSATTQANWQPSACAERDLIAADGHLVHTLAEAVPRTTADGCRVFHIDTTRLERREKQVEVLNRLLRHNVRNDLNLLRGYAHTLCDHDDEEIVAAGTVIDRIADRWLGLAEKGREIEQLSTAASRRTVALKDLLTSAQTAVEQKRPEGVVEVDFDGVDPNIAVSEQWYPAIVELCENGIKHATDQADGGSATAADDGESTGTASGSTAADGRSAHPTGESTADGQSSVSNSSAGSPATVTVTVAPGSRPEWFVIAVADEGPGLPPDERITLRGNSETPLQHGSGLGTWLVRFVVEQFGGRVSVEDYESGGSVVELHLPVPDEDDPIR